MSEDSNLFVTCGKEKMFDVINSVIKKLNLFIAEETLKHINSKTDAKSRTHFIWGKEYDSKGFSLSAKVECYDFNCITISIGCGDKNIRSLSVFPDCSADYNDTFKGEKIFFSIGCFGKYNEIMMHVAEAIKQFGDVYYDFNDCDDEGFVKLQQ